MAYRAVMRVARTRIITPHSRRLGPQAVTLSRHYRRHIKETHCRWFSFSVEDDVSLEKSEEPLNDDEHDEDGLNEERDRMIDKIRDLLEENVENILYQKPEVKEKCKRILRRRRRERQWQSFVFSLKSNGTALHETEPSPVEEVKLEVHQKYDSLAETSPHDTTDAVDSGDQKTCGSNGAPLFTTEESAGSVEKDTRGENQSLLDILRQPIEEETFTAHKLSSTNEEGTGEANPEPCSLLSLLNDESTLLESVQSPASLLDLLNDDSAEATLDERPDGKESSPLFELLQQPIEEESFAIEDSTVSLTCSHETNKDRTFGNEDIHINSSSLLDLLDEPIEDEYLASGSATNESFQDEFMDDDEPSSLLDLLQEPIKDETSNEIVDEGLALLLALRGRDWSQMEAEAYESDELRSTQEDDAIAEESVLEGGFVEENLETEPRHVERERIYDDGGQKIRDGDAGLEDVTVLLDQAGYGAVTLSTGDYNVLLLSIATSSLHTDDTIMLMLRAYRQMYEMGEAGLDCAPDASTFTILMITLDRRAKAPISAIDICRKMIDSGVELNSDAFAEAISCLEKRNDIKDTERLMNLSPENKIGEIDVPRSAWLTLLNMYKNENLQEKALDLVEKCIEVNSERDYGIVTQVFFEVISWPRKSRGGDRIDRFLFLPKVLHLLESCGKRATGSQEHGFFRCYDPPFSIWRRVILALASEIHHETGSGWPLVHRALRSMRTSVEHFWPDSLLLKTGLQASQTMGDAELAVDLILRVHHKQMIDFESNSLSDGKVGVGNEQLISSGTQSGLFEHDSSFSDGSAEANILGDPSLQLGINAGEESDQSITMNAQRGEAISSSEDTGHTTSDLLGEDNTNASSTIDRKSVRVPMQAFSSAMRLCVATGDMNSADRLLDSLRDPRNTIPLTKKIEVFTLALKGYAKTGNSDAAQDLLKDMQIRGLNPTEETYGAVILSLAVAKKTEKARALFEAMKSGQFGDEVFPGVACYNALMLAHIEAHQWEEALECHSRRKDAGLSYSTASFQDVLLASYRLGQKAKATEAIEEALQSELKINQRCFDLSLHILLGGALKSKTFDQTRQWLREIGEQNDYLKKPALNLSRSLRTAQVEEKREPNTKALKGHEIAAKQEHAWRVALEHLVEFSRASEEAAEVSHATSNDFKV